MSSYYYVLSLLYFRSFTRLFVCVLCDDRSIDRPPLQVDELGALEVELYFTAFAGHDVLTRRTVIRNRGQATVNVARAMSATVDFGTGDHHMTHLSGCWAAERQIVTQRLAHGTASFGSRRGTSSHQHNPFVAIHPGGAVRAARSLARD